MNMYCFLNPIWWDFMGDAFSSITVIVIYLHIIIEHMIAEFKKKKKKKTTTTTHIHGT